ncbi:reverse transcriptase domain-containing protein [Enterobacter hormaechei subsp. xiangfangensis]|uniref:reverse transcriptase domain-containing protein n=1 Tax=Enterobacter hormaechei TaxID=158836 RepID=UPI003F43F731
MEMWEHKFELKKDRWVYVPTREIAKLGKKIHQYLRFKWNAPLYFYHLRDGGHVAAAKMHSKSDFFALVDIKNFFNCTTQSRVTRELKKFIPYAEARRLAKLSTVKIASIQPIKRAVPYGFPQSPILASLCLNNSHAGSVINRIIKSGHVRISVYMDDVILSGNDITILKKEFENILTALVKSKYEINEKKKRYPAPEIEVFNILLSKNSVKIAPERMVAFIQAYAKSESEDERGGIARYVYSVNEQQARLHFPKHVPQDV